MASAAVIVHLQVSSLSKIWHLFFFYLELFRNSQNTITVDSVNSDSEQKKNSPPCVLEQSGRPGWAGLACANTAMRLVSESRVGTLLSPPCPAYVPQLLSPFPCSLASRAEEEAKQRRYVSLKTMSQPTNYLSLFPKIFIQYSKANTHVFPLCYLLLWYTHLEKLGHKLSSYMCREKPIYSWKT